MRQVRWASCNIYSTQDHAAAAIADKGVAVFAHKGETLAEYWDFIDHIFQWPNGETCNMILDDGGDATAYVLLGAGLDAGQPLKAPENEEEIEFFKVLERRHAASPGFFRRTQDAIKAFPRNHHRRPPPV